jgi:hypothetical protein
MNMTQEISKPSTINVSSRCRHLTVHGRRCRLRSLDDRSGLCFRHLARSVPHAAALQTQQPADTDLTASFLQLAEFRSALQINGFLAELLALLVKNRVSTKRAAVLAYITNQLLRTLPEIEHELNPPVDPDANPVIIVDGPRPIRD